MDYLVKDGTLVKYQGRQDTAELHIPSGIGRIGTRAFEGLSRLHTIYIPTSVQAIESFAFAGCTSLQNIRMPETIRDIGYHAFDDTLWYKRMKGDYVTLHKDLLYAYRGTEEEIVIPQEIRETTGNSFMKCRTLRRVVVPDSFTYLREKMFLGCTNLQEVILPDGLRWIEPAAFQDCASLETITIPPSMQTVTAGAFRSCSGLRQIQIPETISAIERAAFWGCKHLRKLVIPDSVAKIGADAFGKCYALYDVEIPGSVRSIGANAFRDCTSLRRLTIPDNGMELALNAVPLTASLYVRSGDCIVQLYRGNSEPDAEQLERVLEFLRERDGWQREKMFRKMESDGLKASIALFMQCAYGSQVYLNYFRNRILKPSECYIQWDDAELLQRWLTLGFAGRQKTDALIAFAVENQAQQCYMALLNYKNEVTGYQTAEEMFTL